MKCPNCNETLLIAERHRVEIDYCPSCRGVWLDRGELDKLLDQVNERTSSPRENDVSQPESRFESNYDHSSYHQKHPRKKKSFFSEMFDFD